MTEHHVTMAANGRLVVPAPVRSALGMEEGGAFVMTLGDQGSLKLEPLHNVIARVQEEVRRYIPADVDLAAEMSADRRKDFASE